MIKGVGVITGTKDDVELIEFFILHHLRIGFKKIHIMDFNSTDGTRDILKKYMDHPQLDIILSEASHGTPNLHRWLRLRAYLDSDTDHVIYLDPDEMMVLKPKVTINDVIIADPRVVNEFPRYNITNPIALKDGLNHRLLMNLHKMYFHTPLVRINFPIRPENEWIEWIKQPIPSKVLHQKVPVVVSLGGHYALGPSIEELYYSGQAFIAHFPVTTYDRMLKKISNLRSLILQNPHLSGVFLRYIRICYVHDQGLAEEMFNSIYLEKEVLMTLIGCNQVSSAKELLNKTSGSVDINGKKPQTGRYYSISMDMAHEMHEELIKATYP